MLKTKKLILNNFIQYKKQTFDFDEMFADDNIILIHGKNYDDSTFANDNGAGKSIIYKALLFLLTNRTPEDTNRDSLIGKFKRSMNVTGEFVDSVGNTYWIKRYRKSENFGNDLRLKINGKEKKKGTQTSLTDFMLRTLGISYKRIMNTSILESNDKRSRFVYLGDKEAKNLLSEIKGTDIFARCHDITNNKQKDIVRKTDKKDTQIQSLEKELESRKYELDSFIKLSEEFEEHKKEKLDKKKFELEKRKTKFEHSKANKLRNLKLCGKRIRQLKKKRIPEENIARYHKLIGAIESSVLKFKEKGFIENEKINNREKTINELKKKKTNIICDHCGNKITTKSKSEHIKNLTKEMDQAKTKYETIEGKIKKLDDKYITLHQKLTELEKATTEISLALSDMKDKKASITSEIDELIREFSVIEKILTSDIKDIEAETNEHSKHISRHKKAIQGVKQKIRAKRARSDELREQSKYNEAWVKGFNKEEIQTFALKSTVADLNQQLQETSETLTDGLVEVKLLTEKLLKGGGIKNIFELHISDMNKGGLAFKKWSNGQKKRIEIIMSFALMNLEENVLSEIWLDELFDGVDKVGINKIISLLNKEASEDKQFIIFSHSDDIKNMFTNKGLVTLKNGVSKFELQ